MREEQTSLHPAHQAFQVQLICIFYWFHVINKTAVNVLSNLTRQRDHTESVILFTWFKCT